MSKPQRDCKKRSQRVVLNARKLPDRWIDYDPVGKDMPGTRFVAFKTPLRRNYFLNREETFDIQDVFEIRTLLDMADAQGKKLGLVIDLTATDKYYDPREWTECGIQYAKIWCKGHEAHTQKENVRQFHSLVTKFLSENIYNGKLIGVHCTHGLNRTGYMICRYLIEVDGWNADIAIEHFEYCRGYRFERKEYVDSLRRECFKGIHAALSVEYPGKRVSEDETLEERQTHLKNVLPCADLGEFVAA